MQGSGRVSWVAESPGPRMAMHFPPPLLMATVHSSAKEPSKVLLPHYALRTSKSTMNLLLMPPASPATVSINTTSSLRKCQGSRAIPVSLFYKRLTSDSSSLHLLGWQIIRTICFQTMFSKECSFEWLYQQMSRAISLENMIYLALVTAHVRLWEVPE